MALLLHYTGQDYISRGLLNTQLTPGSTSAIVGGCKTGKGFVFDGTANSRLTSETALTDNVIAISAWFKMNVDSVSGSRYPIFSTAIGTSLKLSLEVYDVNRIRFLTYTSDNTGYYISNTVSANIWYHVYAVLDKINRTMSLYLNGVRLSGISIPGSLEIVSNTRWFIGYRVDNSPFNGQICNLKVYNHVLSAREIAEDYKSLMLHYKLDKPITDTVYDASGFNRHIAVIENTTTNSTTEKRVYGGSLANDGTRGLYGSLNLAELNGINEISVAVRFRYVLQNSKHCYFASRAAVVDGSNGITLLKVEGINRNLFVDIGGRKTFTLPYDLVSGTWYDLVAVKSTTDVKLYINGVLISAISNTNSISGMGQLYASISRSIADNDLTLGNQMNGNVQDIRFYAKALTQAEVTELYQTRHMVDKDSNQYAYELVEDTDSSRSGMKGDGSLIWREFKERIVYPSKYWHTPSYSELYYILNTRTNASNLRTLGRVEISSGTYRNGLFLLPDGFVAPVGITVTITTANYTTNSYTLAQFKQLEGIGVVFLPEGGARSGSTFKFLDGGRVFYLTGTYYYRLRVYQSQISFFAGDSFKYEGVSVRLCKQGTHFSTSTTTKIDFAPANLQYHCTQHIWRFAQHSYDIIGTDNANISDSYNGWIDLFGYGTSGVNYSPTLHTTNNADYASGDIANSDNDWGINEIIENDILGMSEGIITAKEFKEI